MSLKLRQIVLMSRDKHLLSSFLSELLELDLVPTGEGVRLSGAGFQLLILESGSASSQSIQNAALLIDFAVDSYDALSELQQKCQFFAYRFQLPPHSEAEIKTMGALSYFILRDPEGRKWKFSFVSNA